MTNAILAAVIIAALFLAGSLLIVWSRRNTWLRAAAIPLAILASAGSAVAVASTLGFAVPLIGGVTAPAGELSVLGAKLVPNDGIYVMLETPMPRLYWTPWNREMAEKLQEMLGNPEVGGVTAAVPPFEWSWNQHPPSFQPLPQPKVLPDKPVEKQPIVPEFAA